MNLNRSNENRWIMQKNISSSILISTFMKSLSSLDYSTQNKEDLKKDLLANSGYKGRSREGSTSTMGVRLSQMCFYMFGYKDAKNGKLIPSPMSMRMLGNEDEKDKIALINLYSMQYPSPFSNTNKENHIYPGRLLLKLLSDERLEKKLYTDEIIWFLPFVKTIDNIQYQELVEDILCYRTKSFSEKHSLFQSVPDFVNIFSNVTHEMMYYFIKIFEDFGVLEGVVDTKHNEGRIFSFNHGKTSTVRTNRIKPRSKKNGYIKLADSLIDDVDKLFDVSDPLAKPIRLSDEGVYNKNDWINDIYEINPLKLLSAIFSDEKQHDMVRNTISKMQHTSKYSSIDGKDFEEALEDFFDLFEETISIDLLSGSGQTDLLYVFENENKAIEKVNIEAKSRNSSLNMNVIRINRHLKETGSKYTLIIAPRFSRGSKLDIKGFDMCTLEADVLASYCSKECQTSRSGYASFKEIDKLVINNFGNDISLLLQNIIDEKYGLSV